MKIANRLATVIVMVLAIASGAARVSASETDGMADQLKIQNLFGEYVYALNTLDPKAYSALFTPDGVITLVGKTYNGTAEIEKLIQGFRDNIDFSKIQADSHGRKFDVTRHINTSFVIHVAGDTATAESYFIEVRSNAATHEPPSIVNMGRYEDGLVKENGKWLFKKRDIIADVYRARPTTPASQ